MRVTRSIVRLRVEPPALLGLADVEEEFQDAHVALREVLLEPVDLVVPGAPDFLADEAVHARDEHVLVM